MTRALTVVIFALAIAPVGSAAATCPGSNPAITSVAVKNMTSNGSTNQYHMVGTVTNLGSKAQPSGTLQFVDIYLDGMKRDDRGIPPLAPGKSYTFSYTWTRAADAGSGSTTARFRVRMVQGEDCNPSNGTYSVTF